MKPLLITLVVLCAAVGSVVGQKKSTLYGDIVIGQVSAKDVATRELTVKFRGKEGSETFSGTLVDGYKLRMADGTRRDVKLDELAMGTHIRLFYQTKREKVGGQEQKVNKITRIDVLGNDEYFRIRDQLNLDPATVITHAENEVLPAGSTLKVYLAIAYKHTNQQLVKWINKWNEKNGTSYGAINVVSELKDADVVLVVARGADTGVAALPMVAYHEDKGEIEGVFSHATSYVVLNNAGRLQVLWSGVAGVFSNPDSAASPKSAELLTAQMEKRLKARAGNTKK